MTVKRQNRSEFTARTKEVLAKRVNYVCSVPDCRQPTSGPRKTDDQVVSIGVAAHITAASPGGARYDRRMPSQQRRSPRNGIWTCQNHGKLIDNDDEQYPVKVLRKWKRDAEQGARRALEQPRRSWAARPLVRDLHIHLPHAPKPSAQPRPRIVFAQSRGAVIRRGPGGPPIFYVAQLWFRNEPKRGAPIAQSLAGFVTFLRNGIPLFPELRAEWAFTNAAGNVAFSRTDEVLQELLPVGDHAKLVVLQKRTEDDFAYAWSKGAAEYDGRCHPSHSIAPGQYRLQVRLRGIHIDETFAFRLMNPGTGANPAIVPLSS